jgi:hypothetical protein
MSWQIDLTNIEVARAVAVAALVGAWWLWWRLPKRQVARLGLTDPKDCADVEDNLRKTFTQLIRGAAVLIGAALAYLQFTQQQMPARQFSQQQQASHDLFMSNKVAKRFQQLNSDKLVVSLGGIYVLDRVLNASEQYYQPVLETLNTFLRDGMRTDNAPQFVDPPPIIEGQQPCDRLRLIPDCLGALCCCIDRGDPT